jgi:TetR/AcrR family transcriptional regulator, repressor of fatR-cypB operon
MRNGQHISPKLKQRLYPVVLELFSQKDFHQVNMRAISKVSGVSISTIYRYFPSKEELLFAILDRNLKKLGEILELHFAGMKSFEEIVRKLFWVTMDFYDQRPALAITAFITVPTRTWMQQNAFKVPKDTFIKILALARETGQVDPKVDVRRFQDFYYMVCYRMIHSWYYFGCKWQLADAVQEDYDLYWKMLAPGGQES